MNKYRSTYRQKIIELFDEGLVGKDELFINLVNWLSEQDAREFWEQSASARISARLAPST